LKIDDCRLTIEFRQSDTAPLHRFIAWSSWCSNPAPPISVEAFTGKEARLSVWPKRAAVFVDAPFVGHVAEFNGIGKSMLLSPGKHRFKITLPGWQPFETDVNLLAKQRFVLKTDLFPGDITKAPLPMQGIAAG
jgi:hypothetical protein